MGGTGHLYQGRFKFFPVEDDEHFLAVIRYVERILVRANLVVRVDQCGWGSAWRRDRGSAKSKRLLGKWPFRRLRNWLEFVNTPQTETGMAAIRNCVQCGAPYGDGLWTKSSAPRLGLDSRFMSENAPVSKKRSVPFPFSKTTSLRIMKFSMDQRADHEIEHRRHRFRYRPLHCHRGAVLGASSLRIGRLCPRSAAGTFR